MQKVESRSKHQPSASCQMLVRFSWWWRLWSRVSFYLWCFIRYYLIIKHEKGRWVSVLIRQAWCWEIAWCVAIYCGKSTQSDRAQKVFVERCELVWDSWEKASERKERRYQELLRKRWIRPSLLHWTESSIVNFSIRESSWHTLVHHCTYRQSCDWRCSVFNDIDVWLINSFLQQFRDWSEQRAAVHCSDQSSRSLLHVFFHDSLHHWLRDNTLHMYRDYQNHTLLENDVSEESAETENITFRQRKQWIYRDANYDKYMLMHYTVLSRWQKLSDDNCVNQDIVEKLYIFIQSISLFFSIYIVTLAVQWKFTLIIISIVSIIVLMIAEYFSFNASLKTWIVSSKAFIMKCKSVFDITSV